MAGNSNVEQRIATYLAKNNITINIECLANGCDVLTFEQYLPDGKMRELDENRNSTEFVLLQFIAAGTNTVPFGLTQGGQSISKCKEKFKILLDLLVKIATLQVNTRCFITDILDIIPHTG